MNAIAHKIAGKDRLFGPDLNALPTLAEQIALLDAARVGDVDGYVTIWLAVSDQNGGGMSAFWDTKASAEAPAELLSGFGCDRQEAERRERYEALSNHWQDVAGFRVAMQRELMRSGRFIDNRKSSPLEVKAVVRAFLATGGRLLIAPERDRHARRPIEACADTSRFLGPDWSQADAVAASAIVRLVRRWRARPLLDRIIRKLGTAENGWFVLTGDRS